MSEEPVSLSVLPSLVSWIDTRSSTRRLGLDKANGLGMHFSSDLLLIFFRDPKEGCRIILSETPLGEAQWQLGNSKVFIRHPESLFYLEESLERFDYDAAMTIQKAYRKLVARKHAMEQKTKAANLLKGKKDRRSESKDRRFEGDYMRYDQNYGLQNSLGPNKDERVVFADQVLKVSRRMRIERRDFILSVEAFYLVMRANKMGQQFYKVCLPPKVALTTIRSLFVYLSQTSKKSSCLLFKTTSSSSSYQMKT